MSPEMDQALVMGAIGAAVGFFAVRFARKKANKGACSGGDCCAPGKQRRQKRR